MGMFDDVVKRFNSAFDGGWELECIDLYIWPKSTPEPIKINDGDENCMFLTNAHRDINFLLCEITRLTNEKEMLHSEIEAYKSLKSPF